MLPSSNPTSWDYKESIRRQFPDILSRWICSYSSAPRSQPAFRKRGLGLLAASRTIDVFGENCGLVAMKPFPLQFRNYLDPGWRAPDGVEIRRLNSESPGKSSAATGRGLASNG